MVSQSVGHTACRSVTLSVVTFAAPACCGSATCNKATTLLTARHNWDLRVFSFFFFFLPSCSLLGVSPSLAVCLVVCWLLGCLTSQQHSSVSQGWICSDNCTCCHTEIEVADQTFYLTQPQYMNTTLRQKLQIEGIFR